MHVSDAGSLWVLLFSYIFHKSMPVGACVCTRYSTIDWHPFLDVMLFHIQCFYFSLFNFETSLFCHLKDKSQAYINVLSSNALSSVHHQNVQLLICFVGKCLFTV